MRTKEEIQKMLKTRNEIVDAAKHLQLINRYDPWLINVGWRDALEWVLGLWEVTEAKSES